MRKKNPEYMKEIIDYVDQFYLETMDFPTCSQIAEHTSLQRTAVFYYLKAMDKEGKISYDGKHILTPLIRNHREIKTCPVGIVGSIACGIPEDAQEHVEGYMPVPADVVGHDQMYILYAHGDSMIGVGINDGDMVLVRCQEEARDGEIVVAWVEGEGNTLKRLQHRDGKIILHPENPEMEDILVDHAKIQGVAVMVIKDLSNA